jgi:hypothetical protein
MNISSASVLLKRRLMQGMHEKAPKCRNFDSGLAARSRDQLSDRFNRSRSNAGVLIEDINSHFSLVDALYHDDGSWPQPRQVFMARLTTTSRVSPAFWPATSAHKIGIRKMPQSRKRGRVHSLAFIAFFVLFKLIVARSIACVVKV